MSTGVATRSYVYAVTWSSTPRADDAVDVVEHGELAAVTSPFAGSELRARRRDLLRHAEIVQRTFDRGTVVPLRFGAVVDDVVSDLLEPRYDELRSLLRSLDGLVEVTLRAFYREEDVLRAIMRDEPRLAGLRGKAAPVQLGEAVARALAARRDRDAASIVGALRPFARGVAVDERRSELEVLRGALLVRRADLRDVDAAVDRLAREHATPTLFKYTGPLPPHHFADLDAGGG